MVNNGKASVRDYKGNKLREDIFLEFPYIMVEVNRAVKTLLLTIKVIGQTSNRWERDRLTYRAISRPRGLRD